MAQDQSSTDETRFRQVYLFRDANGAHKIGVSFSPEQRQRSVQNQTHQDVAAVHTIENPCAAALERALHFKFAEKRIEGEWFNLTPEDVGFIVALNDDTTSEVLNAFFSRSGVQFSVRLHALRVQAGLTVADLARATGLSRTALYNLENGDSRPSWDVVQRIADALNVTTDDFRK